MFAYLIMTLAVASAPIEVQIRQLGHNDWSKREEATRNLRKIGHPAIPYIVLAKNHPDVEIRSRASQFYLWYFSVLPAGHTEYPNIFCCPPVFKGRKFNQDMLSGYFTHRQILHNGNGYLRPQWQEPDISHIEACEDMIKDLLWQGEDREFIKELLLEMVRNDS